MDEYLELFFSYDSFLVLRIQTEWKIISRERDIKVRLSNWMGPSCANFTLIGTSGGGGTIWPLLYIYNCIFRAGEHETRREKEGEKETVHSPGRIIRGTKSDGSEAGSARAIQKNFFTVSP